MTFLFSDVLEVFSSQLISYALKKMFIFIPAHSRLVVSFQLLELYCLVDGSNVFVDVSNLFVDAIFNRVGTYSKMPLGFHWLSNIFY